MESFSALLVLCAGNSPVPVTSPHKDQWRGALVFSLICAWINDWVNNREADDLRRHRGHYDVNVMIDPNRPHICIPVAAVELSWHVSNCDPVKSDKYVYNSMITSPSIVCMMTSSNGNISALLALCAGNLPVTGEFPSQRPVTRSFDVTFDYRQADDMRRHRVHYDFTVMARLVLENTTQSLSTVCNLSANWVV